MANKIGVLRKGGCRHWSALAPLSLEKGGFNLLLDPARIRVTLEKVILTKSEFTKDVACDIAFHMTDWLNNLEDYYQFCQAPETLPAEEVEKRLLAFLIHVPNHLAAAAKLFTEIPVSDIFGIGSLKQYSAKLLFQWRPVRNGNIRKRRVCEVRIVTYQAAGAVLALKKAKKIGKDEQYIEKKADGEIGFEFVGVMELKDISTGFSEGEVWSELVEMVKPMERQKQLIPDESELDAMRKIAPTKRGRLKHDRSDR
ncbi:MAG: hypothetical protein PHI97_30825 [Desulfobulbus sp.]|nr:hypothetical protein [Desulfobulbus sp.]